MVKIVCIPKMTENDKIRFWSKVEMIPFHDCWEWTSTKTRFGHGQFNIGVKKYLAHRIVFTLKKYKTSKYVLHKCDNPGCVRPEHLYAGTARQNTIDSIIRLRHGKVKKDHCPQGHEYSIKTLVRHKKNTKGKHRMCRICTKSRRTLGPTQ